MIPPLLALFAWIPIGILAFRLLPVRVALLVNFIGGWAVLPGANYTPTDTPLPYWIMGVSLHGQYFITKATITGFTGLLGVFLFDRKSFGRFRLSIWDVPMAMWCLVPIFSAIANPGDSNQGAIDELYHLLAWGGPYFLGRLYFTDTPSLRLAAKGFVIGGLGYIPICLVEFFTGPRLYVLLYGYQPYQMVGAQRYVGYRPIGLLEDGNQLGIWMATAALVALWLWARKTASSILRIPIAVVVVALFAVTLLSQSAGAILLLLALAPFVFIDPRHLSRTVTIVLVLGIVGFAGLRIANIYSLQNLIRQNNTARAASDFLKRIGRGSFGWRLVQDERHIDIALQQPILGYGEWDWWDRGPARPWGLWLLAFGEYGAVGLAALECLLLIPVLRAVWFPLARSDIGYMNLRHTLSAAVLISAIDSLLNSALILPLLLVIGGMSYWFTTDSAIDVDFLPDDERFAGHPAMAGRETPAIVPGSPERAAIRRQVASWSLKKRSPETED
jgi:hypothetical protein